MNRNKIPECFKEDMPEYIQHDLEQQKIAIEDSGRVMRNIIKALSLSLSVVLLSLGLLIKGISWIDSLKIKIPELSYEDTLILYGVMLLLPYIIVSIYEQFDRKSKEKENKEKK